MAWSVTGSASVAPGLGGCRPRPPTVAGGRSRWPRPRSARGRPTSRPDGILAAWGGALRVRRRGGRRRLPGRSARRHPRVTPASRRAPAPPPRVPRLRRFPTRAGARRRARRGDRPGGAARRADRGAGCRAAPGAPAPVQADRPGRASKRSLRGDIGQRVRQLSRQHVAVVQLAQEILQPLHVLHRRARVDLSALAQRLEQVAKAFRLDAGAVDAVLVRSAADGGEPAAHDLELVRERPGPSPPRTGHARWRRAVPDTCGVACAVAPRPCGSARGAGMAAVSLLAALSEAARQQVEAGLAAPRR